MTRPCAVSGCLRAPYPGWARCHRHTADLLTANFGPRDAHEGGASFRVSPRSERPAALAGAPLAPAVGSRSG